MESSDQFKAGRVGDVLLLTVVSLLVLLSSIVHKTLWDSEDEARYAAVSQEMTRTGDYITPQISGEIVNSYPPLMYWLICLFAFLCGGFNDFAVTLPAVAAAVGCVLLTYRLGTLLWNRTTGLIAAWVLLAINGFATTASLCRADMVMVFFQLGTLYLFLRWYLRLPSSEKEFPFWRFYGAVMLGVLAKGPQSLIVTAAIIFIFLLWRREVRLIFKMKPWWGLLIILVGTAPWYAYVQLTTGVDFIFEQNFDAFLGKVYRSAGMGTRPLYQIPMLILARIMPWAFFVPSAFWMYRRSSRQDASAASPSRVPLSWFVIWMVVIVVFYSLAASKRYYYVALIYPAFALLLGWFWNAVCRKEISHRHMLVPMLVLFFMVVGGGLYLWLGPMPGFLSYSHISPGAIIGIHFSLVTIVTTAAVVAWKRHAGAVLVLLCSMMTISHVVYFTWFYRMMQEENSVKAERYVSRSEELVTAEKFMGRFEELTRGDPEPVFYKLATPAVNYYLNRPCRAVNTPEEMRSILEQKRPKCIATLEYEYKAERALFKSYKIVFAEKLPFGWRHTTKVLLLASTD